MAPADGMASVMIHWNAGAEALIGKSYCSNGASGPNSTYYPCDIGGYLTNFGRDAKTESYPLAVMPRVAGPVIAASGGWFVNFTKGAPKFLNFTDMQIRHDDSLLVAIPYQTGSTFKVYAQAPGGCSTSFICSHPYKQVGSVQAVRQAWGDTYFYDTTRKLLYVKLNDLGASFPGYFCKKADQNATWCQVWNKTATKNSYFSRGGLDLLTTGSNQWRVSIEATNCGTGTGPNSCAPVNAAVAPALGAFTTAMNARLDDVDQESSGAHVAAIVGGVVGGVAALVLAFIVAFVVISRRPETERV